MIFDCTKRLLKWESQALTIYFLNLINFSLLVILLSHYLIMPTFVKHEKKFFPFL